MKIIHISQNYIDGWGYQENLLPLYQKKAGHDVVVISDYAHLKYTQDNELINKILAKGNMYEYDEVKIYRIKTFFNASSTSLFCYGLYKILKQEQPDIIFHHNVNLSTLPIATRYKRHHPHVKLYVDNHVDWINESKNKLWHVIFYDTLIPWIVKRIGKDVNYYIGVSPLRCQYLNKVFKVPTQKVRFLPIGCDTIGAERVIENNEELKQKYHIGKDEFVIASGGKLNKTKGTIALIDACKDLYDNGIKLRLVLFGKIEDEILQVATNKSWITLLGWCNRNITLSLLKMADAACWPWLHTTLIEDSVAVGTPLIVKLSDNVSHFAKEQSGIFMLNGDVAEIKNAIISIREHLYEYKQNTIRARNKYSYIKLVHSIDNESFYNY